MRVRLDLAYDGTGFAGWAVQPGLRTVAGELEAALARVMRLPEPPGTVVAGRTDAGVHAAGQVCHVDVPEAAWRALPGRSPRAPGASLVRRLAAVLPPDVRVTAAERALPGFDARFSALRRHYAYRLTDHAWGPPPLRRHDVVAVRGARDDPLDVDAMDVACAALVGLHDFAAFCRPRVGATTIRQVLTYRWRRLPGEVGHGGDAGLVVAEVVADAFCHSMVRSLVGAAIAVGQGRRGLDWPAVVLTGSRRDGRVSVAPARGLVLARVDYPGPDGLAARAREARVRRDERPRAWHGGRMSLPDEQSSATSPEPADHDGVLELADTQDDAYASVVLDEGYSPPERSSASAHYGVTADEELAGTTLDQRLREEEPEDGGVGPDDGELRADDTDTDGELLDDEVGYARAGRLVDPDQGAATDTEASAVGFDVGIDGGAASAEEAAVHVVPEEGDDRS